MYFKRTKMQGKTLQKSRLISPLFDDQLNMYLSQLLQNQARGKQFFIYPFLLLTDNQTLHNHFICIYLTISNILVSPLNVNDFHAFYFCF